MPGGLREVVISFKFRQNRLNGFRDVGGRNLPFPIPKASDLYNSLYCCTTVQAVIGLLKKPWVHEILGRVGIRIRNTMLYFGTIQDPVLDLNHIPIFPLFPTLRVRAFQALNTNRKSCR